MSEIRSEMNHGMSVKSTIILLVFFSLFPLFSPFLVPQFNGKHLHSTESRVTEGKEALKQNNISSEAKKNQNLQESSNVERSRDLSLCPSFCSCSQNEQNVNCFQVEVESRRRSDLDLSLPVPGLEHHKPSFSSFSPSSKNLAVTKEQENEQNVSMKEQKYEPYKLLVLSKNSFLQQLTKTVELKLKGGSIEEIEKESFSLLTLLQSLDLSNNFIRNISKETFSGLRSLQYLNLSYNSIEVLVGETFAHLVQLQHLELQYNGIHNVSRESFHGLFRLRHINLEGNQIKTVEPRSLVHLTRLSHLLLGHNNITNFDSLEILSPLIQILDLSENNLDHVPQGMHPFVRNLKLDRNSIRKILLNDWDNYGSITWITLDHNLITEIKADSFTHLELLTGLSFHGNKLLQVPLNLPSNLRHLNLEGNEIERLERISFQGLWILENLQVSRNRIKFIDPNTFCDLLNLHSLHLEENQIEHIGSIFHNLTRLELLDLSGNPLKILPSDAFLGLKALKRLGLNDLNSIEKDGIGENVFSFIPSLTSLELSRSPQVVIQLFSPSHMANLAGLRSIDLSSNNLATLSPEFSSLFSNLQSVNLLNNQWNCTGSDIDWISNWLRKFPELFIHPRNITCFSPISLSGYTLLELEPQLRISKDFSPKSHITINHLSEESGSNLSNNEFLEKKLTTSPSFSLYKSQQSNTNLLQHQHVQNWSGTSENGFKGVEEGNEIRKDTSNIQDHSQERRMDQVELRKSPLDENVKREGKEDEVIVKERSEGFKGEGEFRSIRSSLVVTPHSEKSSLWHSPVLILAFSSLIPLSLIILLVIQGMNERLSPSPSISCSNSEYVLYSASSQGDQISFVSQSYGLERDHQPLLPFDRGHRGRGFLSEMESSSSSQQVHESLLDSSSRLSLLDFPSCSTSFQRRF